MARGSFSIETVPLRYRSKGAMRARAVIRDMLANPFLSETQRMHFEARLLDIAIWEQGGLGVRGGGGGEGGGGGGVGGGGGGVTLARGGAPSPSSPAAPSGTGEHHEVGVGETLQVQES
jgi:hypothetical protein